MGVDFHQRFTLSEAIRGCDLVRTSLLLRRRPVRTEAFAGDIPILRRTAKVPSAAGEEWGYRWDFNKLIENHDLDYVRVTLPNVGGITEMAKIAALCETHFVGIIPHFTGPIATAALVHALGPFSGPVLVEYTYQGVAKPYLPEWLDFREGKLYANDRGPRRRARPQDAEARHQKTRHHRARPGLLPPRRIHHELVGRMEGLLIIGWPFVLIALVALKRPCAVVLQPECPTNLVGRPHRICVAARSSQSPPWIRLVAQSALDSALHINRATTTVIVAGMQLSVFAIRMSNRPASPCLPAIGAACISISNSCRRLRSLNIILWSWPPSFSLAPSVSYADAHAPMVGGMTSADFDALAFPSQPAQTRRTASALPSRPPPLGQGPRPVPPHTRQGLLQQRHHRRYAQALLDRTVEHLRKMATDVADWDYKVGGMDRRICPHAGNPRQNRLLNAQPSEIALTENVTALTFIAAGLTLSPAAKSSSATRASGVVPWLQRRPPPSRRRADGPHSKPAEDAAQLLGVFRNALTPAHPRANHLTSSPGGLSSIKQMCASPPAYLHRHRWRPGRRHPIDLADAAAAPASAATTSGSCPRRLLYLRTGSARQVWSTLASSHWNDHEDEGFRFTQRGTGSLSLLMGVDAALDFHQEIGPARVCERVKFLGDYLRDGLRKIPSARIYSPAASSMCAGITVYGVNGVTGQRLQDEMWAHGKLRPRASGAIGVRHSTHIFNSPQEIDKALSVVRSL